MVMTGLTDRWTDPTYGVHPRGRQALVQMVERMEAQCREKRAAIAALKRCVIDVYMDGYVQHVGGVRWTRADGMWPRM